MRSTGRVVVIEIKSRRCSVQIGLDSDTECVFVCIHRLACTGSCRRGCELDICVLGKYEPGAVVAELATLVCALLYVVEYMPARTAERQWDV